MASSTGKERYAHGPSEAKTRPTVVRAVTKAKRQLGAQLRALRTERELTQEAAAEAMGVHPKHLQRVEAGEVNVTLTTLVAATLVYKVPLRELFDEEVVKARPTRRGKKEAGA